MMNSVRVLQARCAALGFWPGPIDGIIGARTRAAEIAARASQKAKGLSFIHSSGITRIHWHWTGGGHEPNATDLAAYHRLLTGDGRVIAPHALTKVLAHTLNANTGAIGISLCAMLGAVERPFVAGRCQVTSPQVLGLARLTAAFCREFDIPVSPWSTLSHSEVQPNLGVSQKKKWDVNWLPGMEQPGAPVDVGNRLRDMVRLQIETMP